MAAFEVRLLIGTLNALVIGQIVIAIASLICLTIWRIMRVREGGHTFISTILSIVVFIYTAWMIACGIELNQIAYLIGT